VEPELPMLEQLLREQLQNGISGNEDAKTGEVF
jgi:hypothetical protein